MDKSIYRKSLKVSCIASIFMKLVVIISLITGWESNLYKLAFIVFVDLGLFISMILFSIKKDLLKK